jgi:small subunit ribosomal protein S7
MKKLQSKKALGLLLLHKKHEKKLVNFDVFLKKFINLLMIDGKKIKASKIFFLMLSALKNKIKNESTKKNQSDTHARINNNAEKLDIPSTDVERTSASSQRKLRFSQHQLKGLQFSHEKLHECSSISLNFSLLHALSKALENVTPNLEIRKVRVAGSTYSVPAAISKKKQETLALKWIIDSAKKRQKNSNLDFSTSLAEEIFDASKKLGQARQKRDELHRQAQMNRAYIRYRWW